MTTPAAVLPLGIIGLGPMWRKQYRPAVLGPRSRFSVVSVYDAMNQRAQREAKKLGCAAADSVTELIQNEQVQAVLLLDPQWFGHWPVEVACRAKKPVFVGPSLRTDIGHAAAILKQIEESKTPALFAQWPEHTPAHVRLQALLRRRLGMIQLITGEMAPATLDDMRVTAVTEWAAKMFGAAPSHVRQSGPKAAPAKTARLQTLTLEFPADRLCQLTMTHPCGQLTRRIWPELHIVAEHGEAWIRFPHWLRWRQRGRSVAENIRTRWPVETRLLRAFRQRIATSDGDLTFPRICFDLWKSLLPDRC